jgi:branched-chain amino acid transport system substrate-binding protein
MTAAAAAVMLLVWLAAFPALSGAQTALSTDSSFARGEAALQQAHWSEAGALFQKLVAANPTSSNLDLYLFNLGKAQYYAGQVPSALGSFEDVVARFPASSLRPSALYFSANAMYKSGQRDRAIERFIEAYGQSHDPRLDRLVTTSLASFKPAKVLDKLTATAIPELSQKRKCELAKELAAKYTDRNVPAVAEQFRAVCNAPKEPTATLTTGIPIGDQVEIAVLVPLSGEYQSFGQDLFDGASIAAAIFRKETGKQVKLRPYDTKGDPIAAARLVKDLSEAGIDAIIGPLTSDEAAVTSAALSCRTIPMIAPAATEAGLTMLSDCSFQLSPNIELQGVQMAEYAVKTLHADSAVVISPTTGDQLEMVQSFVKRFRALGGTIVAIEYYRTRDRDYGTYIRDIKSILLGKRADSATFLDDKGDTLSKEATPAQVDCLFMPGSPEEIRLLLPQLRFYNLSGTYLGSDGWGDESVYGLGDDVIRGAVFPSPFVRIARSAEYNRFSEAFQGMFSRKPSRVAGLGYDAGHVLTAALAHGALTTQQLVDQLGATNGYDGVEGRVSFGMYRENIEMPVYKIVGGQPVLLSVDKVSAR